MLLGHGNIARTPTDLKRVIRRFNDRVGSPGRRAAEEGRLPFCDTEGINPNRPFDHDQRLDLGGVEVEVFLTPGHTPMNVSASAAEEGLLFCGDTVVEGYLPNLEEGDPDAWREWLGSLDRIERRKPAVLVPGHGWVLRSAGVVRALSRMRGILHEAIPTGSTSMG